MPRGRPFGARVRRIAAVVAAALVVPMAITAAGGSTAHAATLQCGVDYTTNDWGSGFTANVKINNLGTSSIDGWTVTYAYAGNQTLQSGWNGTWSQSGKNVTVKSLDWNKTIAAGGNVTASANFGYSGTNPRRPVSP
jgi:cellulase/cellobiase CelA1